MDPTIQLANELFEDEEDIFDGFAMLYNNSSHLGPRNSNVQDSVGSITVATYQVQTTESYENPVVPLLELGVPNPLTQLPIASDPLWNGTVQDMVGGFISEGAASSIKDQHMAPTRCYNLFYQSETQNSHMFQGSTIPNEYTTSNQLFEPNFTASNAFNQQYSSSQTAWFRQDSVEAVGAGFGIGISSGQFMSNQSSMFSPLLNDQFISPPNGGSTSPNYRAQHNQFSAVNAYDSQYAPNNKQYDHSNAYDSQYTPNYMQSNSSASYRPTQLFTPLLHEASRPSEMQTAFDSQSQQFMQPIFPSNPRPTQLFTPLLQEASRPSEMQMTFDSRSQQFILPISPFNPRPTQLFTTPLPEASRPSEMQMPFDSQSQQFIQPISPSNLRPTRAMGIPTQQGAPISGSIVTGQRDKAPMLPSSSFGAQPSQSVLDRLIQNEFPIPAAGPSTTLGRNQSLNLPNSMLQRGAASIAENAYPVPPSHEANYDTDSSDEIIKNTVYDKAYKETHGLPLDPHLRSLLALQAKANPSHFPH